MDLRYYKNLYEDSKSSFDTEGSNLVFSSGEYLSPDDRLRLSDAFFLWSATYYDGLEAIGRLSLDSHCHNPLKWIWTLLYYGYPVDCLFKILKQVTALLRREATLNELLHPLREDVYMGHAVFTLLRPFLVYGRYSPGGFQLLHWILTFPSKLSLERKSLSEEGRQSWFDHELWLKSLQSVAYWTYTPQVCDIICRWLREWSPELMEPGYFTSGSTADAGKDLADKIAMGVVSTELADISREVSFSTTQFYPWSDYQFVSRWTQVPKNALALREISMEPAALNWWQSSLDDSLRRVISQSELARVYDPEDQMTSRHLAVRGSANGEYATIDMSKASDCVRPDMIRSWFPHPLQRWLFATRSPLCDVDGQVVLLEKFAPMGSRLTFTIESIIFAAIGWLAEDLASIPKQDRVLRVYGDDVIIETSAAGIFMDLLREVGFIPNEDKSFSSGGFREACGAFAYKGWDITLPTLPRRRFSPLVKADSGTLSWISSLADRSYYKNCMVLRYFCVRTLLSYGTPLFRYPSNEDRDRVLSSKPTPVDLQLRNYSVVSDQPTRWRMRRRFRPPHTVYTVTDVRALSPSFRNDFGLGWALLLHPQARSVERDDHDAYNCWLYYASYRRRSDELCPDDLITCRLKEQHALPPRSSWVSIQG